MVFLIDCYGRSIIEGEISPRQLLFNKIYQDSGNEIFYQYYKNEMGVWIGEYSSNERIGRGHSQAKTNLDWQDLEMIVPEPFDPEEYSRDLIDRMVDDGRLRIFGNNENGEDLYFSEPF
jgi:hypothetical protein